MSSMCAPMRWRQTWRQKLTRRLVVSLEMIVMMMMMMMMIMTMTRKMIIRIILDNIQSYNGIMATQCQSREKVRRFDLSLGMMAMLVFVSEIYVFFITLCCFLLLQPIHRGECRQDQPEWRKLFLSFLVPSLSLFASQATHFRPSLLVSVQATH